MLFDHQNQQIVRRKTQNLELCFGTNVGTNHAKAAPGCNWLWEISNGFAKICSWTNDLAIIRKFRAE